MLLIRSVCVLACLRTNAHTPSSLFMFFFSSNQQVCVPNIRTHIWMCVTCDHHTMMAVQQLYYTDYLRRTHTANTHSHMWTHRSSGLRFCFTRGTVLFLHICFLMLYRLLQATHILSHTHTQIRTHVNHISCFEAFACLFVCYFTHSVRRPNVLFVLLCSCLFGNINVYTCSKV